MESLAHFFSNAHPEYASAIQTRLTFIGPKKPAHFCYKSYDDNIFPIWTGYQSLALAFEYSAIGKLKTYDERCEGANFIWSVLLRSRKGGSAQF